jgi:hypothetical protein
MVLVKLSQQLQSTCCREEDNVCEYFDELTNLHKQLAVMGKTVPVMAMHAVEVSM